MSNCIKLLAVSGCSLILSASMIAEEPYYRSFVRTIVRSFVRSFVRSCYPSCYRPCIHSFVANGACASAGRSAAVCIDCYRLFE